MERGGESLKEVSERRKEETSERGREETGV